MIIRQKCKICSLLKKHYIYITDDIIYMNYRINIIFIVINNYLMTIK